MIEETAVAKAQSKTEFRKKLFRIAIPIFVIDVCTMIVSFIAALIVSEKRRNSAEDERKRKLKEYMEDKRDNIVYTEVELVQV